MLQPLNFHSSGTLRRHDRPPERPSVQLDKCVLDFRPDRDVVLLLFGEQQRPASSRPVRRRVEYHGGSIHRRARVPAGTARL